MMLKVSDGLVHDTPVDFRQALSNSSRALTAWEDISAKARNEWICWIISVKKDSTRQNHIVRAVRELEEGVRRPCCWAGCIHRTDKPASSWSQSRL